MKAKDWIKQLQSNPNWTTTEIDWEAVDELERKLEALEIVKSHIVSPENDSSGIYVERKQGYYEPYYEITLREGAMCFLSEKEYGLLKGELE